jgi:hypothetical protein
MVTNMARHNNIVLYADKLLELTPYITDPKHISSIEHWTDHERGMSLTNAKKIFDSDNYRDFIYDRATGWVLFNIIAHPVYLGKIEAFYKACVDKQGTHEDYFAEIDKSIGNRKYSEDFITNGRGFYSSSVGNCIYIPDGFKFTAQEKIIFREFKFETF